MRLVYRPRMSTELSPFSRWALDDARTADERYMIWLLCDSAKLQEHRLITAAGGQNVLTRADWRYYRELYLNPGLIPSFSAADTERAVRIAPHLNAFPA